MREPGIEMQMTFRGEDPWLLHIANLIQQEYWRGDAAPIVDMTVSMGGIRRVFRMHTGIDMVRVSEMERALYEAGFHCVHTERVKDAE